MGFSGERLTDVRCKIISEERIEEELRLVSEYLQDQIKREQYINQYNLDCARWKNDLPKYSCSTQELSKYMAQYPPLSDYNVLFSGKVHHKLY